MRGLRVAAFCLAATLVWFLADRTFNAAPAPYDAAADSLNQDGPIPVVPPPPPLPERTQPVRQVAPPPAAPAIPVRIEAEMPPSPPPRPVIVDASTGRDITNELTVNRIVLPAATDAQEDRVVRPTALAAPGSKPKQVSWGLEWPRNMEPASRPIGAAKTERASR